MDPQNGVDVFEGFAAFLCVVSLPLLCYNTAKAVMRVNKKCIAFNTHLILCFVLFLIFISLSIGCAIERDIGLS
jgi:L-cystine uptake protein TcyP (sodium:dicarboxylate symporter family)